MSAHTERHAALWYFAGVATFMGPGGIQAVLLPHLLAIELRQSPDRFGFTQMLGQLPLFLLLLFGGVLADRTDPRRVLVVLHVFAIAAPLAVAVAAGAGALSEPLVLLYAMCWGAATAFATPARDALLGTVAAGDLQRAVTRAMAVQFGAQIVGHTIGGQADRFGAAPVLLVQCAVLAVGAYAAWQLPRQVAAPPRVDREQAWSSALVDGLRVLFAQPIMRATFLLTSGLGLFFAGSFVVLVPLALRDLFGGTAQDIALAFVTFVLGTLTSIAALMRGGGVQRTGLALVAVLYFGCLVLMPIALAPPRWAFYACVYLWGVGGGVAMTMSRTIMQELAPPSHRARVLAAFALANAGGAPLGALVMGLAVDAWGVRAAVGLPVLGVAATTTCVLLTHPIARHRRHAG